MKELTINISRDFNKYLGGREKKIADFSGEAFREKYLDEGFDAYDRITIELDGVLGYPWDFLDEVFGTMARRHGPEKVRDKIKLVSLHSDHVVERILYIVEHSKKE
ncbi:MAG: STAS-like domain-containing protein [Desulfobacterales bacterium]|nr:STAS-like domain-containing protein [Desulfobacterales bacterium]